MPEDQRISLANNDIHGTALAIGAAVGLIGVAVVVGSFMLVLVLGFGAVAGAVLAAIISLVVDQGRERRETRHASPNAA